MGIVQNIREFRFKKIHAVTIAIFAIFVQLSTIISDRYLFVFDEQLEKSIPGVWWYVDMEDKDLKINSTVAFLPSDIPSFFEDYKFIKYVKGVAGDSVAIKKGEVFINNKKLTDIHEGVVSRFSLQTPDKNYTLKADEVFVYGTHPRSFDSRYFGPIKFSQIIGEGFAIY